MEIISFGDSSRASKEKSELASRKITTTFEHAQGAK